MEFLNNFQFPQVGPFTPPTTFGGTLLALIQCLVVAGSYSHELSNPAPYSKFADKTADLPSRQGMLIIYTPALLVATTFLVVYTDIASTLAAYLVALHFGKRVMESLFLHKYSGNMDAATSLAIGTFYAMTAALIMRTAHPLAWTSAQQLGLVLFVFGELGNLYHHYLLRQLRNTGKTDDKRRKRYVPPTGGLFHFVAAPHYLCEITAMIGIAFSAQSLHALLVALGMASYLSGRAVLTLRFYQETFDKTEWSPDKKALIPLLF